MKQTVEELRKQIIVELCGIPSGLREDVANQILAIFLAQTKDENGEWHPERLVVLAKDQSLPKIDAHSRNCNEGCSDPEIAQQEMVDEGWHKVEVEK